MRRQLLPVIASGGAVLAVVVGVALRTSSNDRMPSQPPPGGPPSGAPLVTQTSSSAPSPASSAAAVVHRAVQARALRLPLRRRHEPRLAFGKDMVGRLSDRGASVYSSLDGRSLFQLAVERPRAVLSLADGALLVVGARSMQRVELGKAPISLPKPVILPGAEIFADAVRPDRIWVFDPDLTTPTLSSYILASSTSTLALPDQEIKVEAGRGGAFGVTREGVWLYFSAGRAQRFAPGGARLGTLKLPDLPTALLVLPHRRLDQALLLAEDGQVTSALVTPIFKKLSEKRLVSNPVTAQVGDEGRLLAVVSAAGEGPRFELHLYDEALAPTAIVPLPFDEPTGREDWLEVVTRNQHLAVAPRQALIAVGGPDRLQILDARGKQILSIASR